MVAAPCTLETKITIAEDAGSGDLADMRDRIETRRIGLQHGERASHLVRLVSDPFRLVVLGRPPAALVDLQDRGIEHAVAECLQPERGKARVRLARDDLVAAGAMIE